MDSPEQLELEDVLESLHEFFRRRGRMPTDSRIRDSVVEALGDQMTSVLPPILGILSEEEAAVVNRAYEEGITDETVDRVVREVELSLDAFRTYQREQGQDAYLIWSGAFYDADRHLEEKVFRCPIDYPVPNLSEQYGFGALSDDAVILRPDFEHMMVRFDEDVYHLYDVLFAERFLRYCRLRGPGHSSGEPSSAVP